MTAQTSTAADHAADAADTAADQSAIPAEAKTLFRAALALHEAGQLDEAERGYNEVLALAPRYADALHNLGVIACQRGAPEDGLANLFAAMNAAPAKALCWATFAQALEQAGRFVDAWMVTEEALGCGLDTPEVRGVRERLEALAAEAERIEREAYGDNPPGKPAAVTTAVDAANEAGAATEPAEPPKLRSIADLLEATRQLHGAPAAARAAVTTRTAQPASVRRAASTTAVERLPDLLAAGDYAALEAGAREALRDLPRNAVALKALGIALVRQGRAAEAIDPLRRALTVTPREADLHLHLATALVGSGKAQESLASFRRAIALRARYPEAHALLGNALVGLGRADEAVIELRRAAAMDADSATVHRDLARALTMAGRHEEAMGPLRRAQQLDPAHAELAALRVDAA
jgi:tetratricopeptide (TPR) repeat protein